jgi:2-oxo-4-hydroxy-4-carboxy--5-ureidoimidazoline (OHCU) decarboxylase
MKENKNMKYHSQNSKSVCIVLKSAHQELERCTNYVERIFALQNTAKILKLLTDYRDWGNEIEHALSISSNINHQRISNYIARLKTQLHEQIQNMESVYRH